MDIFSNTAAWIWALVALTAIIVAILAYLDMRQHRISCENMREDRFRLMRKVDQAENLLVITRRHMDTLATLRDESIESLRSLTQWVSSHPYPEGVPPMEMHNALTMIEKLEAHKSEKVPG